MFSFYHREYYSPVMMSLMVMSVVRAFNAAKTNIGQTKQCAARKALFRASLLSFSFLEVKRK